MIANKILGKGAGLSAAGFIVYPERQATGLPWALPRL
jgi:hypothetical protein